MNNKINHLAVWILVAVYFLIGWGWYAIFGETWLNLHARTMTDIERTHNISAYLLAFIASIIINYALAWLINRLNATSAIAGLKIALLCWFRISLRRILHDRRVLSLRDKSMAADFHRHGPAIRRLRD